MVPRSLLRRAFIPASVLAGLIACSDSYPHFNAGEKLTNRTSTYTRPLCARNSLDASAPRDLDVRFWPSDHVIVLEQVNDIVHIKFTRDSMAKGNECWIPADKLKSLAEGTYTE